MEHILFENNLSQERGTQNQFFVSVLKFRNSTEQNRQIWLFMEAVLATAQTYKFGSLACTVEVLIRSTNGQRNEGKCPTLNF